MRLAFARKAPIDVAGVPIDLKAVAASRKSDPEEPVAPPPPRDGRSETLVWLRALPRSVIALAVLALCQLLLFVGLGIGLLYARDDEGPASVLTLCGAALIGGAGCSAVLLGYGLRAEELVRCSPRLELTSSPYPSPTNSHPSRSPRSQYSLVTALLISSVSSVLPALTIPFHVRWDDGITWRACCALLALVLQAALLFLGG